MMRFALFGAGFIGQVHGLNVAAHPRAELAYVYDVNSAAAQKMAALTGAKVVGSPNYVWNANDVDAVVVASSTNTHADLLMNAIAAGKPVYCEKPIDLNIDRVKAVAVAAEKKKTPILIGFSRRFDPNHLGVRQAIQSGEIGKIEIMHLTSRAAAAADLLRQGVRRPAARPDHPLL